MTDTELEKLKARRLAEMQKNLQAKRIREEAETMQKGADDNGNGGSSSGGGSRKQITSRDVVVASLGFRGLEVLECAEAQYPKEAHLVINRIAEIIRSENIAERIDGGQLMAVFRMLGMPVRIKTSIKIQDDGKLVSLSDKLRNNSNSNSRSSGNGNSSDHGGPQAARGRGPES